jgi:hypothetical protein
MVEEEDAHFDTAECKCREHEHDIFGLKYKISCELLVEFFLSHTLAVMIIAGLMVERSVLGTIIPSCGVGYPRPCLAIPLRESVLFERIQTLEEIRTCYHSRSRTKHQYLVLDFSDLRRQFAM